MRDLELQSFLIVRIRDRVSAGDLHVKQRRGAKRVNRWALEGSVQQGQGTNLSLMCRKGSGGAIAAVMDRRGSLYAQTEATKFISHIILHPYPLFPSLPLSYMVVYIRTYVCTSMCASVDAQMHSYA